MVQITLTDAEVAVLKDALEIYLSDLRFEIADTEDVAFREDLKRQETTLKKIQEGLGKQGL
jgi:hypothetical protein